MGFSRIVFCFGVGFLVASQSVFADMTSNRTRRQNQIRLRQAPTRREIPSSSGYKGHIAFSEDEKADHLKSLSTLLGASKACVDKTLADEDNGYIYSKYGVFPYFGQETDFNRIRSIEGRMAYMVKVLLERDITSEHVDKKEDTDQITPLVNAAMKPKLAAIKSYAMEIVYAANAHRSVVLNDVTKPISDEIHSMYKIRDDAELIELVQGPQALRNETCVGFALRCLQEGFVAAGQQEYWDRIANYAEIENKGEGTALIEALRVLGWKVLYWNADTSLNAKWDAYESKLYGRSDPGHFRGFHSLIWQKIQNAVNNNETPMYYINPVDDWTTLVDFKTHPPKVFQDIPFFVGIAHLGHHVFAGTDGNMVEAHWDFNPEDAHVVRSEAIFPIEAREFNPIAKANPYDEDYEDGPPLLPHMPPKRTYPEEKIQGGPRGPFFSGLIVVPPGSVP